MTILDFGLVCKIVVKFLFFNVVVGVVIDEQSVELSVIRWIVQAKA